MTHTIRSAIIGGVVMLLLLSGLACSISGGVTVEGPLVTPQAGGEEPAPSTAPPAEATAPRPAAPSSARARK